MIELFQTDSYLIGSLTSIKELAEKESARILCISDSHGNNEVFERLISHFGPDCDGVIFCGDGAGDLASLINMAEKDADFKSKIPPVIAFVQGNCDPTSYPIMAESFKSAAAKRSDDSIHQLIIPSRQIFTVANRKIMIVHGNNQNVDWGFEKLAMESQFSECQIAIYGHTHIAKTSAYKDYTFINPGSCSRPRGGLPPSCAILTITDKFVDTAFIKIGNGVNFSVFSPIV